MTSYSVSEASSVICKRDQKAYGNGNITSASLDPFKLATDSPKYAHFYYGVRIVTGSEKFAGTPDTDIYVSLVGSKACTGKMKIVSGWFSTGISAQYYDDLLVESSADLGEVLVVIIGNPANWVVSAGSAWFVDFVDVHDLQRKTKQEFPCYHWIEDGDEISFTEKTMTLKDVKNNPVLCRQREQQLEYQKARYKWEPFEDLALPSGIDVKVKKLPSDEQFGASKGFDFLSTALASKGTVMFKAAFTEIKSLANYEELATTLGAPAFSSFEFARWTRDEEFGRQILNGVNPVVIEKCTQLPPNFPVAANLIEESLVRGLSLEDEMKAGHIYICNLKVMDGITCQPGWYCAAPICLLYVNKKKQLIPIAIQLKQKPGSDNPIFYPTDNWADWLLAKLYYQSASTQFHQIATHYLPCHAAMEVYSMGTMRNLPDAHPVHKLLRPHFRYTMSINTKARDKLICDGGSIDKIFAIGGEGRKQLMRIGGKAYSIHWTNIERSVKERGVEDPNLLPGYHYRDDGLKIWKAIEDFVTDILNEFYASDEDVKGDSELQNWANDIYTNGFPGHQGSKQGHEFPNTIASKAQLMELCTLIIFTGSAQHAAVNFGQHEMYSYSPNAPPGLRLPPPTIKGKADMQTLLDTLPDKNSAALAVAISHMLSQFSGDELYFGNFPAERFTEAKAQNLIARFRKALDEIDGHIKERNAQLDVPYIYLLPSRIPNSITI
ncbi:hypothetical protein EMCRGX_G029132 [Ephydatia muelleri]|eukprot:Em0013g676a